MSVYLHALTSSGGVPLYSRTIGDGKPLAYPVVGSLNGVHMYGKSADIELLDAHSDTCNICWESYNDSITLIIIADKHIYSTGQLKKLLHLVYNCMVLLCGIDELKVIKSVERFKRDIRVCFGMLDYILKLHVSQSFGELTGCVDVLASRSSDILQNYLNAFSEAADTPHGCLLIQGRVLAATSQWWFDLHPLEQLLLNFLTEALPRTGARDVPVYLPMTSPHSALRLITYSLMHGVEVCLLCGAKPSMMQLEKEVERLWLPSVDSLKLVQTHLSRNLPRDITVDPNILGFVMVNSKTGRCLTSYQPEDEDISRRLGSLAPISKRRTILREFISSTKEMYVSFTNHDNEKREVEAHETYNCADIYKTYAINQHPHQLYILFYVKIPTYAMGSVAKKLLAAVIKDQFV